MGCGASNNAGPVSNANTRPPQSQQSQAVVLVTSSRPLIKPKNYRHGASITQSEISNQRSEFWATRTEGNAQMWQTIRSAAEAILADDIALANAILDASSINTPHGTLEVCYDERGTQYKVPQYCYSNPMELTTVPLDISPTLSSVKNGDRGGGGTVLKLRIRINPGDHNLNVTATSLSTIGSLKLLICDETAKNLPSLSEVTVDRQRIIYLGKQLPDHLRLADAKFDESKVVQVFLRPVNTTTTTSKNTSSNSRK
jgi:hypothetical protein